MRLGRHNGVLATVAEKLRLRRRPAPEADLERRLSAAPPVLIYQMGKVGSSSLLKSLRASWPGLTVHTHNISKDEERGRPDVTLVHERIIRGHLPLFVISPVREPVGRNVSAFFQRFEHYVGVKYRESTLPLEELIEMFLQRYDHGVPLRWFDKNLRPIFDIDVFEHEFPEDGIQLLEHKHTRLLLMRCELPDSAKQAAVRRFLSLPAFRLVSENVAAEKDYGETYQAFKRAFTPPKAYLEEMYESRFFRHFYRARKEEWVRRWTSRTPGPGDAERGNAAVRLTRTDFAE